MDDLNIKLEYLQEWKVESESDDRASVFFKYGVCPNAHPINVNTDSYGPRLVSRMTAR